MSTPLSPPSQTVWAKSDRGVDAGQWLPLHRHMADSAAVAALLWDEWLPERVRRLVAGDRTVAEVRTIAVWLAAAHDLGKATPAFATQDEQRFTLMHSAGLTSWTPLADRSSLPHATASYHLVRSWLMAQGVSRSAASTYAAVPGGHHGVPPASTADLGAPAPHLIGTGPWTEVQGELAQYAADLAGLHDVAEVCVAPLCTRSQVLLTALVILADWLASDADKFPFDASGPRPSADRAALAWADLGLPAAWAAEPPGDLTTLVQRRFDLPHGARPRPMQHAVVQAAAALTEPGMIIVEAPMGEGKTEAALAAAEVLAARHGCGGVFVALPTMATSDAMYSRVHAWLRRLPLAHDVTFTLAHGKASLNAEQYQVAKLGRVRSVAVDGTTRDAEIVVRSWLAGRKKGPLAAFVVGTIDQLLFSALACRHLVLRHLAFAGKVVIIDEAHAADVYMAEYLCRAVQWLGAYGVPVVVLSATLPASRRIELATAYAQGRQAGRPTGPGSPPRAASAPTTHRWRRQAPERDPLATALDGDLGYPVVTTVTDTAVVHRCEPSGRQVDVEVVPLDDTDEALLGLLDQALAAGEGVVVIVRNTVARAQRTAELLRQHLGVVETEVVPGGSGAVRLDHSRFVATDRQRIDDRIRAELGRDGARPTLQVLIGTQVLEQSLDIDADLLVTDLAPMDLLLQRIGRLHRHERSRPAALRTARCHVVGLPAPTQVVATTPAPVPTLERGSVHVYGEAALLDTVVVLSQHLARVGRLRLPHDIAPLVQAAYSGQVPAPDGWADTLAEARAAALKTQHERRAAAHSFMVPRPDSRGDEAVVGWLDDRTGEPEDAKDGEGRGASGARAQCAVRDGEDSLEVLVGRRTGDEHRLLPWLERHGDALLPADDEPPPHLAKALASCSLRLPSALTRYPQQFDQVVGVLEAQGRSAWQRSPWLRGELVLWLDENLTARLGNAVVRYDPADGLRVEYDRKDPAP